MSLLERLVIAAERLADHFSPPPRPPKRSVFSVATAETFEQGLIDRAHAISQEDSRRADARQS